MASFLIFNKDFPNCITLINSIENCYDALASRAAEWATHLAANGSFEHSSNSGEGENLWMGTGGAFSFTQMVDNWGSEKQHFVGGTFPNVSATGNWADVGHYTQVAWKETIQVGCSGAVGSDGKYRFVCRYSPPGNVKGQPAF